MSKISTLAASILAAFIFQVGAAAAATHRNVGGWIDAAKQEQIHSLRIGVAWQRGETWRLQTAAGLRRSTTVYSERRETSIPYLRWVVRLWNHRREVAYRAYHDYTRQFAGLPPHYRGWICVHGGEGSWTDPNPPYWGGLQMDVSFMVAHGRGLYYRKGTADHWTPAEQMWTAERAVYNDGVNPYGAWPNTYPPCAGKF